MSGVIRVTREREELIEELKRASMAVFAGFEYEVAKDLSRLYREAAAALAAPPASDPPGQQPETAEALIQRWQHWCRKFGEAAADEDDDGDARMAQEQIWAVEADMLAYPLPASPQAETTKGDE